MKKLLALITFLLVLPAPRAAALDLITATVSVTNTAGTTNGQTLTVNAAVRTWTNNVFLPAAQILTNATAAGAATNLFYHVSTYPFAALLLSRSSSTNITLQTLPGGNITVSLSPGWGTVSYSTQSVVSATAVRIPITVEGSAQRINIGSGLVAGIENFSTNSFDQNSVAMSEVLGLTNAQTVAAAKIMTNAAGQWRGIVSNSPAISGTLSRLTNGVWRDGVLVSPVLTNGANHGAAFRSPGAAPQSEQFGSGASATGEASIAFGYGAIATGENSIAVGAGASAAPDGSIAIGVAAAASSGGFAIGVSAVATNNSVALGAGARNTAAQQIRLGTAGDHVSIPGDLHVLGAVTNLTTRGTNNFPAGADIAFARQPITSLANGNNAAVPVGTNVFVELSGPTGAFTINGINGGPNRDGKLLILVNQTGQDLTIAHQSGVDATAANRIITMTGADRTTTGNGAATLIYSGAAERWLLIAFDP